MKVAFSVLYIRKVPDYRLSFVVSNLSELIILKNAGYPGSKTLIFLSGITIISYLDDGKP